MRLFGRGRGEDEGPQWVRVAWARHQPEAEMLAEMLRQAGIPVFFRRTGGVDVPDMLAGGPRELMVPAERAEEARTVLDPFEWRPAPGGDADPG